MTHALIIGAGAMGSVLGGFIEKNLGKNRVIYWDAIEGKVSGQLPLDKCVPEAEVVFLCVPSGSVREAAEAVRSCLPKKTPVLTIAKGLEKMTGKTMDQVLKETLPKGQPYGLLSGPMLAAELKENKGGAGMLAMTDERSFLTVKKLFVGSGLKLEYTKNMRAVAWSGILKNIYAMAFGIADGLEWGLNKKGWLISEVIKEMSLIGKSIKVPVEIIIGYSGLGDLVATGFSETSRNHEAGVMLAKHEQLSSEGMKSISMLSKELSNSDRKKLPVLAALNKVINGEEAEQVFERL